MTDDKFRDCAVSHLVIIVVFVLLKEVVSWRMMSIIEDKGG